MGHHISFGPGWPNCRLADQVPQKHITGRVHRELVELVTLLCDESVRRGYGIRQDWSWGYACRAIGGTSKHSLHSVCVAVDINAPRNPRRRPLTTDIPSWMVKLWEKYGFNWGGRWSFPDPMHFEFRGSVTQARQTTTQAKADLLVGGDGQVLKKGDSGDAVKVFQSALMRWRSTALPEFGADGDYGNETETWVKSYQRSADIQQTGIIDGLTAALLSRYVGMNKGPKGDPGPKGDTGPRGLKGDPGPMPTKIKLSMDADVVG